MGNKVAPAPGMLSQTGTLMHALPLPPLCSCRPRRLGVEAAKPPTHRLPWLLLLQVSAQHPPCPAQVFAEQLHLKQQLLLQTDAAVPHNAGANSTRKKKARKGHLCDGLGLGWLLPLHQATRSLLQTQLRSTSTCVFFAPVRAYGSRPDSWRDPGPVSGTNQPAQTKQTKAINRQAQNSNLAKKIRSHGDTEPRLPLFATPKKKRIKRYRFPGTLPFWQHLCV